LAVGFIPCSVFEWIEVVVHLLSGGGREDAGSGAASAAATEGDEKGDAHDHDAALF